MDLEKTRFVRIFLLLYFFSTLILFIYLISIKDAENKIIYLSNCPTIEKKFTCGKDLPTIYAITPTYARLVQKAELVRIINTFKLVQCLHWILIEDAPTKTSLVRNLLSKSHLSYTHLNVETPKDYKLKKDEKRWKKPRGVLQRNEGLKWLRNYSNLSQQGVVYFADDDNTYDVQLFEEMRWTNKVSVWPVGLVGKLRYESPIVINGVVKDWFTYFKNNRTFAIDMAGFSINLRLILNHKRAEFDLESPRGMQENNFLSQLIELKDLEPKAENCTKIYVWHTQSIEPSLKNEDLLKRKGFSGSNLDIEI